MRKHVALAALACTFIAQTADAQEVLSLKHAAKGVETIQAAVGNQVGNYLFDSGIGVTGITPQVATALGCKPWGKITGFRAIGERLDIPRCNGYKLALSDYKTYLPQVAVFDLAKFMGPASKGLSGIVGLDAFRGEVVTLNIAQHQVVVEDAASFDSIRKSEVEVPIRLVRAAEGAALTVDVGIRTASGTAWMELDTGNYGPAMIDKTIAPLLGLDPNNPHPQDFKAAVVDSLGVEGKAVVKDLIMDGNFGRGILRDWEITLDLQHERAWVRDLKLGESGRVAD
ncbi:hypothetical protein [Dyella sp. C9]|uniref:hypothetical protein n=1 Tax=Dyella sp. C9 TaxID=2202154 RepID=UPI00130073D6|nr:hypothetical protein [Dyella sp. C9]